MIDKCPACGGKKFVYDYKRGETVCTTCGTVIAEGLADPGPEWRAIEAEERGLRARAGPSITRPASEA